KSHNLQLEREINLGSSIFGWLNRYVFVPLFTWLGNNFASYGLVILLLTIIVKIVLFPIAYKSFLSAAKMRVMKPEIDQINEKYGKDDPMKKQQATMALYKQAGINPAAGCIPLLLQIPILFTLIRLFPAAYELRQQPFLWATDLSTYDSVWNFGFSIPGYGDHMSLFALLMTVSTILYTWMNQQMLSPGSTQLPGMKWLIYLMPVIFLFALNKYSAALSYYYFVSNIITFGQMFLMRRYVDHDAIRAKIDAHKLKPVKQSGFMQRLEQAQRKRMEEMKKQQANIKGKKK
ncbi:MAG TPA: membrane protein insertase YidC, partial [Bacteroidia bacterium]|nr:membrane protein insertase YidC [Bacteroidia bacterium]